MELLTQNNNNSDLLALLDNMLPTLNPPEEKGDIDDENIKRYIKFERQIDSHTIKRSRVLLTPGVCNVCGLDLVNLAFTQNKLTTNKYDELAEELQTIMKQLVQKHKSLLHNTSENLIVTEKPRRWLSGQHNAGT